MRATHLGRVFLIYRRRNTRSSAVPIANRRLAKSPISDYCFRPLVFFSIYLFIYFFAEHTAAENGSIGTVVPLRWWGEVCFD